MTDHQWITLHRVRFPDQISANDRKFDAPSNANCWRFCPSQRLGSNDLPTWNSDVWCGFGIFDDRETAQEVVDTPNQHLTFLSETIEAWHALAIPVTHRGQVNWRGQIEDGTAVKVAPADPGGTLCVLTSAGFISRTPDQHPRIAKFARKVGEVLDFFDESAGNIRRGAFNGGFDGREGLTVSLWRSDKAMMETAYWEGTHRRLMDESRDGSLFDYSSFTRARIMASHGSWDGNPIGDMN